MLENTLKFVKDAKGNITHRLVFNMVWEGYIGRSFDRVK